MGQSGASRNAKSGGLAGLEKFSFAHFASVACGKR
jgi:hypothetical protein